MSVQLLFPTAIVAGIVIVVGFLVYRFQKWYMRYKHSAQNKIIRIYFHSEEWKSECRKMPGYADIDRLASRFVYDHSILTLEQQEALLGKMELLIDRGRAAKAAREAQELADIKARVFS